MKAASPPAWLLAALVPALAHVTAYAYWAAYGWVYGIPISMISVEPSDALAAFTALAIVFFYFNAVASVFGLIVPQLPWWVREPTRNLMPLLALGSLFAIAASTPAAWYLLVAVALMWFGVSYAMPLIHQRAVEGYGAKLRADTQRIAANLEGNLMGPSPLAYFDRKFPEYASLFAIGLLVVTLSLVAGWGRASSQTVFMYHRGDGLQLLVGVVADRAYLRQLDADGPGGLVVLPANQLPSMESTEVPSSSFRTRRFVPAQ